MQNSDVYRLIYDSMVDAIKTDDNEELSLVLQSQEAGDISFTENYPRLFFGAAKLGSIGCLKELLPHLSEFTNGMDTNSPSVTTAQMSAVIASVLGHMECLQFILDNIHLNDENKTLALMRAIENDHIPCIDLLLPMFESDAVLKAIEARKNVLDTTHIDIPPALANLNRFVLQYHFTPPVRQKAGPRL